MSVVSQLLSPNIKKMTIRAFADASYKVLINSKEVSIPVKGLVLPFNPEQLNTSYGSRFQEQKFAGGGEVDKSGKYQGSKIQYSGGGGRTLSFNFHLDSTLPDTEKFDIAQAIDILEVFGYAVHADTGEPPYLEITWGGEKFQGRMATMAVNRTLFDHNGKPLQATIALSLIEQRAQGIFTEKGGFSITTNTIPIPDMPVLVTLMALLAGIGAALTNEIMDYVQTGFDNDMDNLYAMVPGGALIFGSDTVSPAW